LPTTWAVFLVATPEYSVVNDPWLHVPLLAAVLATATVVANLNEYHLLGYLVRFGLGERIRRARVYGWALRWFQRSPFQLLMLMAFIPIPVDAVRWLAILSRYPRLRFGLAYFVGRWLRYLVFAACSTWWALSPREIVIFQLVLAGAALALRLGWALRRGLRRRGQGAVGASEPATVASAMFTARARSASDG
jgi:membrane protein YqaA with SNARE-associated domain